MTASEASPSSARREAFQPTNGTQASTRTAGANVARYHRMALLQLNPPRRSRKSLRQSVSRHVRAGN